MNIMQNIAKEYITKGLQLEDIQESSWSFLELHKTDKNVILACALGFLILGKFGRYGQQMWEKYRQDARNQKKDFDYRGFVEENVPEIDKLTLNSIANLHVFKDYPVNEILSMLDNAEFNQVAVTCTTYKTS